MRRLIVFVAFAGGLYAAVRWWRGHRRTGAGFVNRVVNPWLLRSGIIRTSHDELGIIEHVGRRSGTVRRTPVHPVPIEGGYRIIVPIGEASEWVRNVRAAGHCRLILGDRVIELDEPMLETAAQVPELSRPVRALFDWLGFRYLRLHTLSVTPEVLEPIESTAVEREAVPA
jgi:deazaflavin-dependent oxidoreductase (nitroreductase family)